MGLGALLQQRRYAANRILEANRARWAGIFGAADTTFLVEADREAVEVTDEIGYTAFHGPAG